MKYINSLALAFICICVQAEDFVSTCQSSGRTYVECKIEHEASIITGLEKYIQRDGKTLHLKPLSIKALDLKLVDSDVTYTVKAHFPDQFITLIDVTGWEYFNAYIYHHKTGAYIEVFNNVRFSNNGKYMIAFGADFEAGFRPNSVAVYSLGHWGGPKLLTMFNDMYFGVNNAKFISSKKIKLETYFFGEGDNGYANGYCFLSLKNNIWQFEKLNCNDTRK